ncbi:MAG: hypothetical protein IPH20_26075 [Bacteroidales bacterium]|nr:hypothetical protein [Bacteroidales bacterium]
MKKRMILTRMQAVFSFRSQRHLRKNYSRPTVWPLLLVALPEHHSLFQKVNKNPLLLPEGIGISPAGISIEKLGSGLGIRGDRNIFHSSANSSAGFCRQRQMAKAVMT